jgi:hypothetical protein
MAGKLWRWNASVTRRAIKILSSELTSVLELVLFRLFRLIIHKNETFKMENKCQRQWRHHQNRRRTAKRRRSPAFQWEDKRVWGWTIRRHIPGRHETIRNATLLRSIGLFDCPSSSDRMCYRTDRGRRFPCTWLPSKNNGDQGHLFMY